MNKRMKNGLVCLAIALTFASCKDKSAPTISSFKINGVEVTNQAIYSASRSESATFQVILNDDEDLLQFIAFIDTTGVDDKERLYAKGLSGTEGFAEFTFSMRFLDSLGQRYFFGLPVPVQFVVTDQNTNSTRRTVSFEIN